MRGEYTEFKHKECNATSAMMNRWKSVRRIRKTHSV